LGGACGAYAGEEKYIQDLAVEACKEEQLDRRRLRWKDNIGVDLKK
jgi:hypothetical protein